MQNYHWPGNIRQLKNIIERLYISDEDGAIHASELPLEITSVGPLQGNFYEKVKAYETTLRLNALKDNHGNQRAAADSLGMTYGQFRHFYKKYKLDEVDRKRMKYKKARPTAEVSSPQTLRPDYLCFGNIILYAMAAETVSQGERRS